MLTMQQQPQRRQPPYAYPGGVPLAYENPYTQTPQMQQPEQQHSFNAYAPSNEHHYASSNEHPYGPNYELAMAGSQHHENGFPMYQSQSNSSYNPSSPHDELPPTLSTTASAPSIHSTNSSTVGSPYLTHGRQLSNQEIYGAGPSDFNMSPAIVNAEEFNQPQYNGLEMDPRLEFSMPDKVGPNYVDPSLLQPATSFAGEQVAYPNHALYQQPQHHQHHHLFAMNPSGGPPTSSQGDASSPYAGTTMAPDMAPDMAAQMAYMGYQPDPYANRRASLTSLNSIPSRQSPMSGSVDYDYENQDDKGRCPHPECGRVFKDLKAHMLTHQPERPEKCPISNCEYNIKGFARKYDKNRHTLTHYKGTMVCGFCPGLGSSEKNFNRADVFKRHLTAVHGVEQTPPNSRKRGPGSVNKNATQHGIDLTGKCSTCTVIFSNAQDFYEHLDDCVLRVVQQAIPSEAINQRNLAEYAADEGAQVNQAGPRSAARRAGLQTDDEVDDDDTEEESEEDEGDETSLSARSSRFASRSRSMASRPKSVLGASARVAKPRRSERTGLTFSQGGVPLPGRGRSKRKAFPPDWGMPAEEMTMKKRVLCVYEGKRRLGKDEMMMKNEFQVHMASMDGKSSVSDLDVETMKRSEALHGATREEQGPWNPDGQIPEYSMGGLN